MAGARIHLLGSIYTRWTGLLEGKAVTADKKPIWYDIYKFFPPVAEPRLDKEVPKVPVRKILYQEDFMRAEIHKIYFAAADAVDLSDNQHPTVTQKHCKVFTDKLKEGVPKEEALRLVTQQMKNKNYEW